MNKALASLRQIPGESAFRVNTGSVNITSLFAKLMQAEAPNGGLYYNVTEKSLTAAANHPLREAVRQEVLENPKANRESTGSLKSVGNRTLKIAAISFVAGLVASGANAGEAKPAIAESLQRGDNREWAAPQSTPAR